MNVQKPNNNNNNNNHHHQACAACKYQRRKCQPDCILAPYFPPSNQQQFLNAHKLFGVSNIIKRIKDVPTQQQKDEAMRSIIFEAEARANDPVGGCYRIMQNLENQLALCQAELGLVKNQLAICRAQIQHFHEMNENERKMSVMGMGEEDDHSSFVVVTDDGGQRVLVPWGVDGGGGGGSHVDQQNQNFLEMFDDPLPLDSIECRVKTEEVEQQPGGHEIFTEVIKPTESVQGHESTEAASLSTQTEE